MIAAGGLFLAIGLAFLIAWLILRKSLVELDGWTVHARCSYPRSGDWTFDVRHVRQVARVTEAGRSGTNVITVRSRDAVVPNQS